MHAPHSPFLLATFANVALAYLITQSEILIPLRAALGGYQLGPDGQPIRWSGKLIMCPYCVATWTAALFASIMFSFGWWIAVYWLGIAGSSYFLFALMMYMWGDNR